MAEVPHIAVPGDRGNIVYARPPGRRGEKLPRQRWRLRSLDRKDIKALDDGTGGFDANDPGVVRLYHTKGTKRDLAHRKGERKDWLEKQARGETKSFPNRGRSMSRGIRNLRAGKLPEETI